MSMSTSMKTGLIPYDVSTPSYTFWQNLTYVEDGANTVCSFLTIFRIIVVLPVLMGNPDFYDSGGSGSLANIVLVPRPENDEIEL